MPPRRGLGRGLDALIASTPEPTTTIRTPEPHDDLVPDGTPFEVDIDRIEANPRIVVAGRARLSSLRKAWIAWRATRLRPEVAR